jgi:hypothetical protein
MASFSHSIMSFVIALMISVSPVQMLIGIPTPSASAGVVSKVVKVRTALKIVRAAKKGATLYQDA